MGAHSRRNRPIPKSMYEAYAPGPYKTGYHKCPKCSKERVKDWWCFACSCRMIRMPPKIAGMTLGLADIAAVQGPSKIIRQIVL